MPYFTPSGEALSSNPTQRTLDLDTRIQSLEADLQKLSLFPLGEKSVNYRVLQGLRKYWIGIRDDCMPSEVAELFFPESRPSAVCSIALMERELDNIKLRMDKESMPEELGPDIAPKAADPSVFISRHSNEGLQEIIREVREFYAIDQDEIENSQGPE
jgi:hypothetical protein